MTEFLTTPGGDRVAFDVRGEGPALIFIAGAGPVGREPETAQTAELAAAAGLTTLVYDRLGRGESELGGPATLDREVDAIGALIERVGGRAALCGHSSGCTIALAAATRGLPVTALALWEAPIEGESKEAAPWAAEFGRRVDAGDNVGALEYYMKDMPPEWLEGARQAPFWPAMVAAAPTNRVDADSLAWAESAPLSELLGGLDVPVMAIVGEETMPLMIDASQAIVDAVPGAAQRRIPGANHTWEPAPMAAVLVELVQGAESRAGAA
ncbi:alpha/beta fold hydrolase [Micromonospora sp. DT81.3]|uniref:alpha/beta fold hydrolase n=1 Tax=Actinomycetes TaxID=1760 RepID=UPI003CE849E7